MGGVNGGYPPLADAQVFQRGFGFLRHLLQQPFDRQVETLLPEHLIAQSELSPGAYLPGEAATLRKDLEKRLAPYGFGSAATPCNRGGASMIGRGDQGKSAALCPKAPAITAIWGNIHSPTETPPVGFEPTTGCLEGCGYKSPE